jgi:hypothetical protein
MNTPNDTWHTGTGTIKYDPFRFGMKNKTKWWAIVQVDKEITRYYRWWVKNQFWIDLCQPSWDAHISIIRGETPNINKRHLWKKYDKQKIEFIYQHNVRRNDNTNLNQPNFYWFVDVKCLKLTEIRNEFEFPSNWDFHLTIGRTWY